MEAAASAVQALWRVELRWNHERWAKSKERKVVIKVNERKRNICKIKTWVAQLQHCGERRTEIKMFFSIYFCSDRSKRLL